MFEKLKEKGLQMELLRFADEGHVLAKLNNKIKGHGRVMQ
jgi:dipeptidyl aminopeptidase/acylaminoacyl peptidase